MLCGVSMRRENKEVIRMKDAMKRIIALLMGLVLVFGIAACGNTAVSEDTVRTWVESLGM